MRMLRRANQQLTLLKKGSQALRLMKRPYGFDPLDTANGNEDTEENEENAIMEADHEEDNDDSNTLRYQPSYIEAQDGSYRKTDPMALRISKRDSVMTKEEIQQLFATKRGSL